MGGVDGSPPMVMPIGIVTNNMKVARTMPEVSARSGPVWSMRVNKRIQAGGLHGIGRRGDDVAKEWQ